MKKYRYENTSKNAAVNLALYELNRNEEDVFITDIEITEEKAIIEIIVLDDVLDFIKDKINEIFHNMGITKANMEIKTNGEGFLFSIYPSSKETNILIGRNGRNIDSLRNILYQIMIKEDIKDFQFDIDIANYKAKKIKRLKYLARNSAYEVKTTKIEVKLEPMNAFERKIIHEALKNDKYVTTSSVGEEPNRCVEIKLKKES